MSSHILEEFYRGNIIPAERQMVKDSEMARAAAELSEAEALLDQTISPELRPILKRFTDAHITVNDLTAETYYIDGFRTGARFMLDIMDNSHENLEPVRPERGHT